MNIRNSIKNVNFPQIWNFIKKFSKKLWRIIAKIFFLLWMILIVANIMWLYYFEMGKGLQKLFDITHKEKPLTQKTKNLIATNFTKKMDDELFTMNCNLWDEWAYWRFMLEWNKMCIKEDATEYVINHELVHYSLWNLPIYKKMKARPLIKEQIKDIKKAVETLDETKLTSDDWTYYKILVDHVNMFAGDSSYKFYNWVKLAIFYHRWNEEFIAYAIGPIVDIKNQKLKFVKFKLEDPLLKKIDQRYREIYWLIAKF